MVRWPPCVRLAAVLVLLVPAGAVADGDAGRYSSALRFSPEGARMLVGVCDMDGDDGALEVRTADGTVLEQVPFEALSPATLSCTPALFEAAVTAPTVIALLARHGLSARPHRGGLSVDQTRYVGVDDEKGGLITLFLVDALGFQRLKYAAALETEHGTNAYAVSVAWAPRDAYAVVAGSRATAQEDGVRHWEPVMLKVGQASRRPGAPVDKPGLARKLNGFGYRAYKRGDHLKATERYEEAVGLDPRFETALYNLACMRALAGRRDDALRDLERLRDMGTAAALEKLAKAPRDPDFRDLLRDPEFRRLTGR